MIAVINACGANLASVLFALQRLGKEARLTIDPQQIRQASHVILPGVGSAAYAMQQLEKLGIVDVIRGLTQPVLGICLGLQLLFESSAEGDVPCLGILPGRINKFSQQKNLSIPHMGWNTLQIKKTNAVLMSGISSEDYFYFIHSFIAPLNDYTVAAGNYGEAFAAVVQKENFCAVQFHPERSSKAGEKILKNFLMIKN